VVLFLGLNIAAKAAESAPEPLPWWGTALIAFAAALLGALAGARFGFLSNVRLDERRRKVRSRLRRKAKVYTPVLAELAALQGAMGDERHLDWGIVRGPEEPGPNDYAIGRRPGLHRWDKLVVDGRARVSASKAVRMAIEDALGAVDEFNRLFQSAHAVFAEVAACSYQEAAGSELISAQNVHLGRVGTAVRDAPIEPFRLNQHPQGQQERFTELFDADQGVQEARTQLLAADKRLREKVAAAVKALETGIDTIARKYEQEDEED